MRQLSRRYRRLQTHALGGQGTFCKAGKRMVGDGNRAAKAVACQYKTRQPQRIDHSCGRSLDDQRRTGTWGIRGSNLLA
jgi:hypothetical protein